MYDVWPGPGYPRYPLGSQKVSGVVKLFRKLEREVLAQQESLPVDTARWLSQRVALNPRDQSIIEGRLGAFGPEVLLEVYAYFGQDYLDKVTPLYAPIRGILGRHDDEDLILVEVGHVCLRLGMPRVLLDLVYDSVLLARGIRAKPEYLSFYAASCMKLIPEDPPSPPPKKKKKKGKKGRK
jgi:hypothetical protein